MMNHKAETNFIIKETNPITANYQLLVLKLNEYNPLIAQIQPGQFVQAKINRCGSVFLRRPISIHDVNATHEEISLLVRKAGPGTAALCDQQPGDSVNLLWPLGNGFTTCIPTSHQVLLAGGGVGVAPLLYLGKVLKRKGLTPNFLIGARTKKDLLRLDSFQEIGPVAISTDDGSYGEFGLITHNSILSTQFDMVYCCGPMPMMKGVAKICREKKIECEVSLENVMACGIGACLCCVEKTVKGNRCVCTEGPVFNINELTW